MNCGTTRPASKAIIVTTINSSISVKPWVFLKCFLEWQIIDTKNRQQHGDDHHTDDQSHD